MPKILIADDSIAVRKVAERLLTEAGMAVSLAANGTEALTFLGKECPDLVVSDVIMPGLDGPAWVREAHKACPGAKVIFMSGYAEDAFVGGESGVAGAAFLPKPFTLNELTQKVKDQLEA